MDDKFQPVARCVEPVSDADLVARSRAEPSSFGEIFDRHHSTIYRYIARRIGPDSADDLTGEVFRIAFERRQAFDPQWSSARPWLYGIATNLVRSSYRSEQRRLRAVARAVAMAQATLADDPFERATERLDASAQADLVANALAQLSDGDRDALILFAVERLSYSEVATALGIPIGTVRSRINRARSQLRELLGSSGQQHHDPHIGKDLSNG